MKAGFWPIRCQIIYYERVNKMSENCFKCGCELIQDGILAGYGVMDGEKYCYDCCASFERDWMIEKGRTILYLDTEKRMITDWPGKLRFKALVLWRGRHNLAGVVYFARFIGPDGAVWSGKCVGDWTMIFHCRRTKLTSVYA